MSVARLVSNAGNPMASICMQCDQLYMVSKIYVNCTSTINLRLQEAVQLKKILNTRQIAKYTTNYNKLIDKSLEDV